MAHHNRQQIALWRRGTALLTALLLAACSGVGQRTEVDEVPTAPEAETAAEAAAHVGNPLLPNGGDPNAINYNVTTSEELEKIDNGSDEELIWTNPDNPDEELPDLVAAFENKRRGNGWLHDMGRAVKLAKREGYPLIVWFHDSVASPKSKTLGAELLDTQAFNNWCQDRVVRVKLDAGASLNETAASSAKYNMRSINSLQRRYGMSRKPALAVISPQGKIVTRIDGFDGFVAGVELELRHGVEEAEKQYAAHKETLRAKGYREWHSRKGNKDIFARLQRFDEKNNMVYLREPGGKITRTRLESFSRADIDYLDEQARNK
ncbi:MAG: hypothetical protein IJB31_05025 [Akkermansia sp.]|nr:hypothetical protein [Akkermansia sp.]